MLERRINVCLDAIHFLTIRSGRELESGAEEVLVALEEYTRNLRQQLHFNAEKQGEGTPQAARNQIAVGAVVFVTFGKPLGFARVTAYSGASKIRSSTERLSYVQ